MHTLGTLGWYFAACACILGPTSVVGLLLLRLLGGSEQLNRLGGLRRLPVVLVLETFGVAIGFVAGVFVTNVQASHGAPEPSFGPFESPRSFSGR